MATALSTLITRSRRYMRDYPDLDATTASVASGGTSLTVADTTKYTPNWPIELDQEVLLVTALASGTSLTVRRGMYGSTAASHASGVSVLLRPAYYAVEYIDCLNAGLDATFPLLYKQVLDTSLTAAANTYEYAVPSMPSTSIPIPLLERVELKEVGDYAYRETRRWQIRRGAAPQIKFQEVPITGSTIRVCGYGPFSHLSAITDSLDAQYPAHAESLLPLYAAGCLLQSGEAGRVRLDSGVLDQREQANRAGSSMAAAQGLIGRFEYELRAAAMPPIPRHVVSVF